MAAAPGPRRAPKGRGRTFAVALAVLAVLLLIAVALSLGDRTNTGSGSGTAEASNDLIAVRVLEVRATDNTADAPLDMIGRPDQGKHFVFVNVNVTNKGSEPERYGPNMFHLLVGESSIEDLRHVSPALNKTAYKVSVGVANIPVVQPGSAAELWVPFEVEDGAEPQRLVYYNGGDDALALPL